MGSTARCAADSGRFAPAFLTLTTVTMNRRPSPLAAGFFSLFRVA